MNKFGKAIKSFVFFMAIASLLFVQIVQAVEIVRQKNVATHITFPIVDADGDIVTGAAELDSEFTYHADGTGAVNWADATNEATEIEPASGWYDLSLAQAEMNHDYIDLQIKTSTSGAKTQHIKIRTIVGDPLNIATSDDGGTINVTGGKVDEVAALTGHTAQTGDAYARLGAPAGASVSADVAAIKSDSAAILVDTAAMDTANELRTLLTGGTSAVSILNAADVNAEVDSALNTAIPGSPTANSINERIAALDDNYTAARAVKIDFLDEAISGIDDNPWDAVTRTLTAGTNISLAKGTGITGFNDVSAADVNAQVDQALADIKLDKLLSAGTTLSTDVHLDSVIGQMLDAGTTWSFDRSADALEQISGLAGGTDWSADEKTEIKAVLGITSTGTPDSTPENGALKNIQDAQTTAQADLDNPDQYKANVSALATAAALATAQADLDNPSQYKADVSGLATAANQSTIITHLTDIKGATFSGATDSLEAIRNRGDAAWIPAVGFSTHSAADVAALILLTPANKLATDASGRVTVGSNADKTGYQVNEMTAAALADFFNTDSGTTFSAAVSGSVVKETTDNAGGGTTIY